MQIKFFDLNLWEGGKALLPALRYIKENNPDIVHLQEVYNGTAPELEPRQRSMSIITEQLNYPYKHFAPAFADSRFSGKPQRGNAILSKFPINFTANIFYDIPYSETYLDLKGNYEQCPRNLQHVVVDAQGILINLYNTHGIWGPGGADTARRIKMSDTIITNIKDKKNIILSGDFNVRPDTKTIQKIEEHLTNIFKNELTTSFNMQQKDNSGYADVIVDFIFLSKNIKVLEHTCPQINISDHLPLLATLEI